jgi:hypothetical protein
VYALVGAALANQARVGMSVEEQLLALASGLTFDLAARATSAADAT